MNRIKILILSAFVALGFLAIFSPKPAQAAWDPSIQTLQDAIDHAYRLCGIDNGSGQYCDLAVAYNNLKLAIANTSPENQKQVLQNAGSGSTGFNEANVSKINTAYLQAIANHQINNDGTSRSVGQSLGSCNDGKGVQLSVGVNSANECVGDANTNPIYAYLRGIIIIMGGVIGLAMVVTLIVSGIQYSSSSGDPQAIAKAKGRIVNAVIGLLLYIMLAAILRYLIPNVFK